MYKFLVLSFLLLPSILFSQVYTEDFFSNPFIASGVRGTCTSNLPSSCAESDFTTVDWFLDGNFSDLIFTSGPERSLIQTRSGGGLDFRDTNSEFCWNSPVIDVSGASEVTFSVDISESGNLESSNPPGSDQVDYVDLYYTVGNGSEVYVPGSGDYTLEGNFTSALLVESGISLSGATDFSIRICIQTTRDSETITINEVVVDVTLPTEVISFTTNKQDNGVALTWETASEVNNSHFILERSTDAIHFSSIGEIEGAGNSNQLNAYSFFDKSPAPGINYYRLKQVDWGGEVETHQSLAVFTAESKSAGLFPSMATNEISLILPDLPHDISQVSIFGPAGRLIKSQQVSSISAAIQKIDIADLPSGSYYLRVDDSNSNQLLRFMKL